MSHKIQWRGLLAAAALLLTSKPVFSQDETIIQMIKPNPEDTLFASARGPAPMPGFALSAGEFGGPMPPPFPMPPGGTHSGAKFMIPLPPIADLELTDNQISQLAKLKRTFENGNSNAFATLRALENEMMDKLSAENISDSEVRKIAEEVAQQKADISKRFSAHLLDSAKVLTPEQRKKMRLAHDRMEIGPLGGFGKPPFPPPPPPGHQGK